MSTAWRTSVLGDGHREREPVWSPPAFQVVSSLPCHTLETLHFNLGLPQGGCSIPCALCRNLSGSVLPLSVNKDSEILSLSHHGNHNDIAETSDSTVIMFGFCIFPVTFLWKMECGIAEAPVPQSEAEYLIFYLIDLCTWTGDKKILKESF